MTYPELMQAAGTEMDWMGNPTDLLDRKVEANQRKQKCREEVAAMPGMDVSELK